MSDLDHAVSRADAIPDGALSPADTAKAMGVDEGSKVPAKFLKEDGTVDNDKLLASYLALESNRNGKETAADESVVEPVVEDEDGDDEAKGDATENPQLAAFLKEKGFDMATINKEFYEGEQSFTPERLAELNEAFGEETVANHIRGVKAANSSATDAQEAATAEVYAVTGSEDNFSSMMKHFEDNGGTVHAERYNAALDSDNMSALRAVVADMYVDYRANATLEPTRRVAAMDSNTATVGYSSQAEMRKDLRNPEYRQDPSFRAKVEAKAAVSNF
jgi:hypothetical protein